MSQSVDPPVDDDLLTEQSFEDESDIERAVEQARLFHNQIDEMKAWSRRAYSEILAQAAVLEATEQADSDEADEIRQVARLVLTVSDRIEQGDTHRVRQP
ncbi:hypothetical protein [Haloferax larsenii]|uniref:Uncharacterized protein n=1 Tax=Haloferax larsenii TaxID=302484 RepID=A0A1H7N9W5_HALLR|nr:hypothetical protein [Haloferax larsenii]SEL19758.1 hypothetical protein SAMN04488691_103222 [Haloferax larsenii]